MNRSIRPVPALILLLLVALPRLVFAQQPGGMDPAEMMKYMQDPAAMQRMAQQAEAMQKCMKGIDQKKLDALKTKAEAASREIQTLCDAGKKDEALTRALALGQEMRGDATVQKLQECTKDMADMMRSMPWSQMLGLNDKSDPTEDDVCR